MTRLRLISLVFGHALDLLVITWQTAREDWMRRYRFEAATFREMWRDICNDRERD